MKLFTFVLILVMGLLVYRFFQLRPKLIAVSSLEGKVVLWGNTDSEKISQIEEAFRLTKDLIPKTLELRIKARNERFVEQLPISVYFIEEKDWFYIFADNYPYKAPGIELVRERTLEKSIRYHKLTKEFKLQSVSGDQ